MYGHALFLDSAYAAWRQNIAGRIIEHERAAVQVCNHKLETAQRLRYVYRMRHKYIIVIASENIVFLLLQYNY